MGRKAVIWTHPRGDPKKPTVVRTGQGLSLVFRTARSDCMQIFNSVIAGIALLLSGVSIWATFFRRGKLITVASQWTAIGMDAGGQSAASMTVRIAFLNTGTKPVIVRDVMMVAVTAAGNTIAYEPILLFDIVRYISGVGTEARITDCQQGPVPLPVLIPPASQFEFPASVMFLPEDKKTAVLLQKHLPVTIELYYLSDRRRHYQRAAVQYISEDEVRNLKNGAFAGLISTESKKRRPSFQFKTT